MAKNWNPSWASDVGVNHTPAYQVSGRPFAKNLTLANTTKTQVKFEYVTRWVQVTNHHTVDLKVAFSSDGLNSPANNYFIVPAGNASTPHYHSSARLELKVSEIWLLGNANNVSVVAGMTSIRPNKVSGSIGPSWSGSLGVS